MKICVFEVLTTAHVRSFMQFFPLRVQGWRQVYAAKHLTYFTNDTLFDVVVQLDRKKVPVDNTTSGFAGRMLVARSVVWISLQSCLQ